MAVLTDPRAHQPGVGKPELQLILSPRLLFLVSISEIEIAVCPTARAWEPTSLFLMTVEWRSALVLPLPHIPLHGGGVCVCSWLSQDGTGSLQLVIYYMNPGIPGAQHRA